MGQVHGHTGSGALKLSGTGRAARKGGEREELHTGYIIQQESRDHVGLRELREI